MADRQAVGERVRIAAAGVVLVALAAACSDDGGALSTIPNPPPSSSSPTSGSPTSSGSTPPTGVATSERSSPRSDTATSTPTTDPPATSTSTSPEDLDQLRRDVEQDFLRSDELLSSITRDPTRKDRSKRLREAVLPGSELFQSLQQLYRDMLNKRHQIRLGDPPVLQTVVERIEFSGEVPYSEATVTYCVVTNAELVSVAPNGEVTNVGPPQGLAASRSVEPMRLTDDGWKPYEVVDSTIGYWKGARSCPDA